MFKEYLIEKLTALYEDRIIIFDFDDIEDRYSYASILVDIGWDKLFPNLNNVHNYLQQQYKNYICNTGTSFDTKDSTVMTHGGISIDEIIVPFIKIKAVQNG